MKDKIGTVGPYEYNWREQFGAIDPAYGFQTIDGGKVYGLARSFDQSLDFIKTILSLVFPSKPLPGLDPTFYHTGTYEDDLYLYNELNEFIIKYNE